MILLLVVLALALLGALIDATFAHNQIAELTKERDRLRRAEHRHAPQHLGDDGHIHKVDLAKVERGLANRARMRGKR